MTQTNQTIALSEFKRAYEIIKPELIETRLIHSDYYSQLTRANVYFKPENLQRTGSYKIRGSLFKISQLTDAQKACGIIAASAGNHAQGVARAAKQYGVKAIIVMPESTPLLKINATKEYGAEVILSGAIYDDAYNKALELSEKEGYTLVHPFDDLQIATGQGTLFFEIIEQLPTIDVLLVPIGGGGLAAGVATLARLLKPNIQIIGVEPSGAASMLAAIQSGKPTALPLVETIADGTAVRLVGKHVYPLAHAMLDDIITVDDIELVDAFLALVEKHKIVAENAGVLSVAALKKLNIEGKNVVSILSGGNIDVLTIAQMIQRGLMLRDRVFTFSVFLSNKPGELVNIASLIAENQGNVIKLDHNQFASMDRFSQVELQVTVEAFGSEHKKRITTALEDAGYNIRLL